MVRSSLLTINSQSRNEIAYSVAPATTSTADRVSQCPDAYASWNPGHPYLNSNNPDDVHTVKPANSSTIPIVRVSTSGSSRRNCGRLSRNDEHDVEEIERHGDVGRDARGDPMESARTETLVEHHIQNRVQSSRDARVAHVDHFEAVALQESRKR